MSFLKNFNKRYLKKLKNIDVLKIAFLVLSLIKELFVNYANKDYKIIKVYVNYAIYNIVNIV